MAIRAVMSSKLCVPIGTGIEVEKEFNARKSMPDKGGVRGVKSIVTVGGVLFTARKDFNPYTFCQGVLEILEKLDVHTPFVCSWAYIEDKFTAGCFGGGSSVVVCGRQPHFIDAAAEAAKFISQTTTCQSEE